MTPKSISGRLGGIYRSHPALNFLRHIKHASRRRASALPLKISETLIHRRTGGKVASGPFRGAYFGFRHVFGAPLAKLLGTYERELHEILCYIAQKPFDTLINIGAAEGYYAIGLSRMIGFGKIYCFDTQPEMQALIRDLATRNGVADIAQVAGFCDAADLRELLQAGPGNTLLIMDVEGYELALLDAETLPALANVAMIIESHDFIIPDCTARLVERLTGTHALTTIHAIPRHPEHFPLPSRLPPGLKLKLMNEGRPDGMRWLVAVPKRSPRL